MNRPSIFCLLVMLGTFVAPGQAAESPATVIGTPDRLIVSSPFDQDHPQTRKKPLLDGQAGIGKPESACGGSPMARCTVMKWPKTNTHRR